MAVTSAIFLKKYVVLLNFVRVLDFTNIHFYTDNIISSASCCQYEQFGKPSNHCEKLKRAVNT